MSGQGRRPPAALAAVDVDRFDMRIAELAARQDGVVTRPQLRGLGLSDAMIDWRIRTGRLHVVHRGVYAVGHPALSERGRLRAAVLAAGEDGCLSHLTAAACYGLIDAVEGIDVLVLGRAARSRPGLRIHRTCRPFEVRMVDGLPVTAPLRTLADVRPLLGPPAFAAACSEALVRGLVSQAALEEAGLARPDEIGVTRGRFERELFGLLRRAGLPLPLTNHSVGPYVPDYVWPQEKVILEADGFAAHGHRAAFESDRERDAELAAAGWVVVRVTWRQLKREPWRVIARLAQVLARRAAA